MTDLARGQNTPIDDGSLTVAVSGVGQGAIDLMAFQLGSDQRVRSDADFIFFNQPTSPEGAVRLVAADRITVDLRAVPAGIEKLSIAVALDEQVAGSLAHTGNLGVVLEQPTGMRVTARALGLTTERAAVLLEVYRRQGTWKVRNVSAGWDTGLAALVTHHGVDVSDQPAPPPAAAAPPAPAAAHQHTPVHPPVVAAAASAPPAPPHTPPQPPASVSVSPISFENVKVTLSKDSATKTARIDLRKSQGDPNWVLTVGLEWDGRGAHYDPYGRVTRYGTGDLDVYFFCRDEVTNKFVVISGEPRHRGTLDKWPFIHHDGDSKGPGNGNRPAVEQVRVLPTENGDLLVNVYQSVDNGTGAIDAFGRPRVAIRYGRAAPGGLPGDDADEILVYVGNGQDSYWATIAHIDVQDGILTVDGETRYSHPGSEHMPGLDTTGTWVREPQGGPVGRSKKANRGIGLTKYTGRCPTPTGKY
ncbi:TerD family protein [Rhodococcus opacus]|uniref:TerD family protein n=1 Tax=Rhodococcus opacus TaxID=37919 RepID=UPI002954C727|nr:TerD family protein [Rhodococcus opacus]MDV7091038.1 TerD family protein [Rhodococcus opacus]